MPRSAGRDGARPSSARGRVARAIALALAVTGLVVASAAALTAQQEPTYRSSASIAVAIPHTGVERAPAMGTEREIAMSLRVAEVAARGLDGEPDELLRRLAVTVPVDTNVLHLQYDASSPMEARRGAAAFARAYLNDRESEATGGSDYASIISPADLPEDPASPNWIVNLAAAFVLGLGLGVAAGYAYLLRARQGDVEAAEAGALASLGAVPAGSAEWLLDGVRSQDDVEAYRRLRAHLLSAAGHTGQLRSVVVASPRGSAATTSVTMQLGAALAQAGYRTVMVAAESDPPSLALLGIDDRTPGLTTLLVKRGDPQALLFPTGVERLAVLPPGGSSGISDVLAGRGRRATFARLAPVADFAVVDAGGVLTSATALEVARDVPVALLVIGEDEPPRDVVAAAEELRRQGAHLLGTVVWVAPSRRTRRSLDAAELVPGFPTAEEEDPPAAPLPTATRTRAASGQWQRAAAPDADTTAVDAATAEMDDLATTPPTLAARSRK